MHSRERKSLREVSVRILYCVIKRNDPCGSDVQKLQRKVEGDLKLTQEAVCDLERVKEDMVATQQRKDKEASCVSAKIEDEKTLGFKYTKQVLQIRY